MHLLFFAKQTTELRQSNWMQYCKNNVVTVLWSFYRDIIPYFWDSMTMGWIYGAAIFVFNIELYHYNATNSTTPKFDSRF
jgi:hypothetical protein